MTVMSSNKIFVRVGYTKYIQSTILLPKHIERYLQLSGLKTLPPYFFWSDPFLIQLVQEMHAEDEASPYLCLDQMTKDEYIKKIALDKSIVINGCYGGFSLSELVCTEYTKQTRRKCDGWDIYETEKSFEELKAEEEALATRAALKGIDLYEYRIKYGPTSYNIRDDPIICDIVERLGSEESKKTGRSSYLSIEPYDSDLHPNYNISDYDGIESVESGTDDGQTQKLREDIHEKGSELEVFLADLADEGPLEDMSKEKLVARLSELAAKTGAFTQKLRSMVPPPVKIIMEQKKRVLTELLGSTLQPSYKEALKRWPIKE